MRAVVCTRYGPPDVLELRDMPKPVPKDDEVLVRIRATTVSAADCELRRFDFAPWIWVPIRLAFGIRRPRRRVLGQDLAGDVESVGKDVRSLRKGDRVFAATGIGLGAYAEYISLRANPATGGIAENHPQAPVRALCFDQGGRRARIGDAGRTRTRGPGRPTRRPVGRVSTPDGERGEAA